MRLRHDNAIYSGMELFASLDFCDSASGPAGFGMKVVVHGNAAYCAGRDGSPAARLGKNFWLELTKPDGSPLLAGSDAFTLSYDSKPSGGESNQGWVFFAARTVRPPKYAWESYLGIRETADNLTVERFHNFGSRPASDLRVPHHGNWRHVDVVFTKDSTTLYINGNLMETKTGEFPLDAVLSEAGGFASLGRAGWNGGEYYEGLIQNFQIWKPADAKAQANAAIQSAEAAQHKPAQHKTMRRKAAQIPETQAYLFVHFTGKESCENDEQIYFALSADGIHWQDLRPEGQPVLTSSIGERGVRDPYILRSFANNSFYLIATDLSIYRRGGWADAGWQTGSTKMLIWESPDLVRWSEARLVDVAGRIPDAGMLWAPEAIYDEEAGNYFVFWATLSTVTNKLGDPVNIYCSTTRDFRSFSEPLLWIDEESGIIDTTVIKANGSYYRASRCDGTVIDKCDILTGDWTRLGKVEDIFGEGWVYGAVEGPELFAYNAKDCAAPTWGLIVDRYSAGKGYMSLRTTDIGDLSPCAWSIGSETDFGALKKRHGSILTITQVEYERLLQAYGNTGTPSNMPIHSQNPILPGQYADPDIALFDGRYYLYPTTDGFENWSGWQFKVFYSDNLMQWADGGIILDLHTDVPWTDGNAWAPAIAAKNGRYYFYFCGNDKRDDRKAIGVAVAGTPTGPFNAMKEPLLTYSRCEAAGVKMGQVIDPQIFTEDNGTSYLLFGNGEPALVQLQEDMVSRVPGTMQNLAGAVDFREAIAVTKIGARYHFAWSCNDTGDADYLLRYGCADSLFGPIVYKGILLQKDRSKGILGTGHHAILHDTIRGGYHIVYHRFLTPPGQITSGFGFHREVCIDRLEYQDGFFLPVIPT